MIFFELFYTFFLIGLFTFGGGYAMIPMIQDSVVSRGWMTNNELTDFIAISESTPGPFAINIATFVGSQVSGFGGAVCATIGVVLPSFIVILIVAMILKKFINNRYVNGALKGIRPIVLSLILSTAILLFIKVIFFTSGSINYEQVGFSKELFALFVMLGGFMIIYKKIKKKSINPLLILLLSAIFGVIVFI